MVGDLLGLSVFLSVLAVHRSLRMVYIAANQARLSIQLGKELFVISHSGRDIKVCTVVCTPSIVFWAT